MKFLFALSYLLTLASAADISANSMLGKNLLSKARRLEQNNNAEFENDWVSQFSIKFQGCHAIKQWNDEAQDDEDVKIETKRLVRFRLCPTDTCSANKAAGCTADFGDYVIDMDTFMDAYFEARRQEIENQCEYHLQNNCGGCEDNGNDDFNADYCEYDCFYDAGMTDCIDENPYEDNQADQQFELDRYMECGELQLDNNQNQNGNNNNGGRQLNQQNQYFVGPYCSEQGGSIYLGLFTDDACSIFSDYSFEYLTGFELPYSTESLVTSECLSCMEHQDQNENNNNDNQDADQVIETCEQLYSSAGKCESNLPQGTTYSPNENACNYMEGIRIVRQDGIIQTGDARASAVATAFIVIFAMAFAAMAFYVWYLRTRLGVKQHGLL